MARPGRPERNRAARSFRQLRRFHHVINSDKVFGTHTEKEDKTFLHRGISTRSFKRQFTLADHVEVKGARFENGLLIIELQREVPEAMKPRRIAIAGASQGERSRVPTGTLHRHCQP